MPDRSSASFRVHGLRQTLRAQRRPSTRPASRTGRGQPYCDLTPLPLRTSLILPDEAGPDHCGHHLLLPSRYVAEGVVHMRCARQRCHVACSTLAVAELSATWGSDDQAHTTQPHDQPGSAQAARRNASGSASAYARRGYATHDAAVVDNLAHQHRTGSALRCAVRVSTCTAVGGGRTSPEFTHGVARPITVVSSDPLTLLSRTCPRMSFIEVRLVAS